MFDLIVFWCLFFKYAWSLDVQTKPLLLRNCMAINFPSLDSLVITLIKHIPLNYPQVEGSIPENP